MMNITEHINENLKKTVRFTAEDEGELIAMPYPYTVPCAEEGFRCMYYWDTYFTNLGLLVNGMAQQARFNTDNMLYMVDKYGFMPNGNMTRYLNRSQPPFLYLMVKDVYGHFGDKVWLSNAYNGLSKEYEFWQTKRKAANGLNFYGDHSVIEEGKLEELNNAFKERSGGYTTDDPEERLKITHTFKTFEESGWDCCSRFDFDGEFYNPVDLNSLLYGLEKTMSEFALILQNGESDMWCGRAAERKEKMDKLLWNENEGLYLDWNFKEKRHSSVKSVASLYPMFVGMCGSVKGEKKLLNDMMLPYGIACSVKGDYRFSLQWDYPNVWAPLQYVAYKACKNYGLDDLALEISKRYIRLIEEGFQNTGNLWEKYDGNTGKVANQDYEAPTMMGWTAGIYLYFKKSVKFE